MPIEKIDFAPSQPDGRVVSMKTRFHRGGAALGCTDDNKIGVHKLSAQTKTSE
jgi:hypothetical protein